MASKNNRFGEEKYNNQGCLMRIVEYNNASNIIVEFQDKHKFKIKTEYSNFKRGNVKNPYYPSVYGVGIIGDWYQKYYLTNMKEYKIWSSILQRCFDSKAKEKRQNYKDTTCCTEWLYFKNFYEWLHSQENFYKWINGNKLDIDKDILIKGNNIYSPETCLLIPHSVNSLFTKSNKARGSLPLGVVKHGNRYQASSQNMLTNKREHLGTFDTPELVFNAYKKYKENLIKQVAQVEFDKGNIAKECYDAMMNYQVEITD